MPLRPGDRPRPQRSPWRLSRPASLESVAWDSVPRPGSCPRGGRLRRRSWCPQRRRRRRSPAHLPVHYLQLGLPRVPAAGDRVRGVEWTRGQPFRLAGHLGLDTAFEVKEVHALPDLARAGDPQVLRNEDRAVVPAAERGEHLVPVEQAVGDTPERYLGVDLYGGGEDIRLLFSLGPDRLVDAGDKSVEVSRVYGEAGCPAVAAPLPHKVAYRVEGAVEVDVGLASAGRAAVGVVGPAGQYRRRPSRSAGDAAGDQTRDPSCLFRHDDLEVLLGVNLSHRPLDGKPGPPLPLGVELVQEGVYPESLPTIIGQKQVESRPRVLYPAYGVDAWPQPPPEVVFVELPPHPCHLDKRLDTGPRSSGSETPVYVLEAHAGECPVVPDEGRDVDDGTDRDEVEKPTQALSTLGVPQPAGDG